MNKTAFRGRFVSILIILLFAFIIAVFIYNKNPLMAEANVITTDNYKIRSSTSIEKVYLTRKIFQPQDKIFVDPAVLK